MNAHALRPERQKRARPAGPGPHADDYPEPFELLEGVVAASRALLEETDFNQGLARWLAHLAEAVHANRATYGSLGTREGSDGDAHVRIGWSRCGTSADSGTVIHETRDCVSWFHRLRDGETVHAQLADLADAETNRIWNNRDCQSILLVPVVVDGRSKGWLGFEWKTSREWPQAYQNVLRAAADSAEIAIKRLEADQRALSERETRLAVERQRAEEAEADAQSVRVRGQLIQGVTEAAQRLLGPGDFDAAVTAALTALGTALTPHRDRVVLVEDVPAPGDRRPGRWRLTHEWHRRELPPQVGTNLASGDYPSREWWERVNNGDAVILSSDFDIGPHKILTMRVPGPVRRWLAVAFEDIADNSLAAAELAVLQTAAACLGAALQRRDVEAERLAQERKRTDEALALNRLLEGVVAASRALLETSDFEDGLKRWLAQLAQALDADRALYGSLNAAGAGRGVALQPIRWTKGGRPASDAEAPVMTDITAWSEPLGSGQAMWVQREDIADAATAQCWDSAGVQTVLLVPVSLDGHSAAFLVFDWTRRRERRAAYETVLRTAADGAAAAIKRHDAVNALVAERERSANERSAELAKANAGMQRTLARLAASQNIDSFLATALLELHQHSGSVAAYLFVKGATEGGPMRLRARFRDEEFEVQGIEDDPPVFASGFQPTERPYAELLATGRMIWREIEPAATSPQRTAAVQRWHHRKGHLGEARYLLQVGDRVVGMIALAFTQATPLTESQCELLVALSQPIALALELSHLGEVANRGAKDHAVLAERNRMARDVHDTLAQGFTAISLQLQAATLARTAFDRHRFIARATLEAKTNLAESRRTIRILRGVRSPGAQADGLTDLLEDALTSRLGDSAIKWHVAALPADTAEPPLSDDVRRELKRIAQEAATNALKHAQATVFEVAVNVSDEKLTLEFSDDGRGFDPRTRRDGFGLIGMRERAERIGATIQFRSRPGGPTTICVTIVIEKKGEQAA